MVIDYLWYFVVGSKEDLNGGKSVNVIKICWMLNIEFVFV